MTDIYYKVFINRISFKQLALIIETLQEVLLYYFFCKNIRANLILSLLLLFKNSYLH